MYIKRFDGSAATLEALTLSFAVEQFTDETLPPASRRRISVCRSDAASTNISALLPPGGQTHEGILYKIFIARQQVVVQHYSAVHNPERALLKTFR